GNVLAATNRRGHPIHFTYDDAGRVTSKSFADGSRVTYAYDAHGNLHTAEDASGTTTLDYDDKDQLKQITYPGGRLLKYGYDPAGRRVQMVDQDGFTRNYSYDTVGRLASLRDGQGQAIVSYTYDALSRLSRKDLGNHTFTTFDYDEAGQVRHVVNHAPDGSVNSHFDYSYDGLGRRTGMATADGQWTYRYDATGQLTHATFASSNPALPDQDLTYEYDAAGNRVRTTVNGTVTPYQTNDLNQYTMVGTASQSFDADGNLIGTSDGTGTSTFTYDDENRLVGVAGAGGTWTYQYDAFGHRTAV